MLASTVAIMNFLSKKTEMEPIIGLPTARDITIIGHIWPCERGTSYRDVRFHFHSKNPRLEVDVIYDLLRKYVKTVDVNPTTFQVKCIMETPLVPLIQAKLESLGLNIKWLVIKT